MQTPCERTQVISLADLALRSKEMHTGPYPSESYQFHRLVPLKQSHMARRLSVELSGGSSFIYLRVTQKNGQMAWSSPVFVDGPR
jgi:hypothetical protein